MGLRLVIGAPDEAGQRVGEVISQALEGIRLCGLLALSVGAVLAITLVGHQVSESRRMNRHLGRARGHYVHPHWLTEDAVQLLARAQQAADTIRASRLHQDDLGGLRVETEAQLPHWLWRIADSLHQYSKMAKTGPSGADTRDPAVQSLPHAERSTLADVLAGIETQVAALEDYARQAHEVDLAVADRTIADQFELRSAAVRDLAAKNAAVQAETAEIAPMAAGATAVAKTLTELRAERDSEH
ncbi:hypothetical protein ACFU7Y_40890 [Kitasatospora sp. NPDC057542]|uniref:hypothetical protein n=1 Tax=Kitasatospora sp. NPDC057542 TaxID=3346162 RepID=UPI0036B8EE78